jgi:nitronate monooxygenase
VNHELPAIIQGGMGAGVSTWRLARAVSRLGQMGVVSGTALDVILVRRLQCGDLGGPVRRALAQFPIRGVAERILDCFFLPGGKSDDEPFRAKPIPAARPGRMLEDLLVAGNFVEVFLAKEGHTGRVGINYLEKIQVPTLPSLYGAMLAGVDWILMGAGIPKSIPGILDRFARTESASLKLDAVGTLAGEEFCTEFVPQAYSGEDLTPLARPKFAAIISAATRGWVRGGRSGGGRSQCAAARSVAVERPRGTDLWRTRRLRLGGDASHRPTVLARRRVRDPGRFEAGSGGRRRWHSSGHRLRLL